MLQLDASVSIHYLLVSRFGELNWSFFIKLDIIKNKLIKKNGL